MKLHISVWDCATFTSTPLPHVHACTSHRLYGRFTMESLVSIAFGRYVGIQNGEANQLTEAASDIFQSQQESNDYSPDQLLLLLCELSLSPLHHISSCDDNSFLVSLFSQLSMVGTFDITDYSKRTFQSISLSFAQDSSHSCAGENEESTEPKGIHFPSTHPLTHLYIATHSLTHSFRLRIYSSSWWMHALKKAVQMAKRN